MTNFGRGISIVVNLVSAGCLASCILEKSPESVVKEYYQNLSQGRFEEAYALISHEDHAIKSLEAYKADILPTLKVANATYKVSEVLVGDKRAQATVIVTGPDKEALFSLFFAQAMREATGSKNRSEKAREKAELLVEEKLKSGDYPKKAETQKIALLKSDVGWRLFPDWKAQQLILLLGGERIAPPMEMPSHEQCIEVAHEVEAKQQAWQVKQMARYAAAVKIVLEQSTAHHKANLDALLKAQKDEADALLSSLKGEVEELNRLLPNARLTQEDLDKIKEEKQARYLALGEKAQARGRAIAESSKEEENLRAQELRVLSSEVEAALVTPMIMVRCEAKN